VLRILDGWNFFFASKEVSYLIIVNVHVQVGLWYWL